MSIFPSIEPSTEIEPFISVSPVILTVLEILIPNAILKD